MKRIGLVLLAVFVLSGCGLIAAQRQQAALKRQQEAFRRAELIAKECKEKRLRGELKGYAESVQCSHDRMRQVIAESGYSYMDLVDLQLAYGKALAQRLDNGEITEADAELMAAELQTRLNSEAQRRDMVTRQAQLQTQQAQQAAWQNSINMLNENLQRQQDRNALMAPRTMTPITCHQYGNVIQCF